MASRRTARWLSVLGPFLGLLLVVVAFAVADRFWGGGAFLEVRNFRVIAAERTVVAVAALGMTVIILAGGIDLSAGTATALAAVVLAVGLKGGWPWPAALAAAIGTGGLCGLANGLVIAKGRIVPFIVTLGTMTVWLGVGKILAEETTVRPDRLTQVPTWLSAFASSRPSNLVFGLPLGVWIALAVAAGLAFVLNRTVFGRHVTAVGSNEAAARLSGLPVDRIKIAVYTLGGLFFGTAGVYQFSRLSIGDPTGGVGLELEVIAAVVIGGGSLSGGRGSIVGTLAGAAMIAVIRSGCTQLGVRNPTQDIILGLIIVVAVAVDQYRQRRAV